MTFRSTVQVVALCGFVGALAHAEDTLKFEVASIKPADPGAGGHSSLNFGAGGLLRATNNTLKQLITFGYDVRDFQVSGGPGWLDSARYDIVAKPEHEEGPAEFRQMSDAQQKTAAGRLRERLQAL